MRKEAEADFERKSINRRWSMLLHSSKLGLHSSDYIQDMSF